MPVEIKELTVRAIVSSDKGTVTAANNTITAEQLERIKRDVKRECMEEIKQLLNQYKER